MKVYHGSWMEIAEPDLKHSRTDVDFIQLRFASRPLNGVENLKDVVSKESLQHMNLMKARAVA